MAKKVYEEQHIANIANAIRDKTGGDETYKPSEMASGIDEVYDAGQEQGKKDAYDRFWDTYQLYGKKRQYPNAFYAWDAILYNPKYSIFMDYSTTSAFSWCGFTDTKVDIELGANADANYMFANCGNLKTIRKLIVKPTATLIGAFRNCGNLENLTIEGVIGQDFDIKYSPLTIDSAKSIINALKNYLGTDKEYSCTLYFSSDVWANLEADSTAPTGDTWQDYVFGLGWNI